MNCLAILNFLQMIKDLFLKESVLSIRMNIKLSDIIWIKDIFHLLIYF